MRAAQSDDADCLLLFNPPTTLSGDPPTGRQRILKHIAAPPSGSESTMSPETRYGSDSTPTNETRHNTARRKSIFWTSVLRGTVNSPWTEMIVVHLHCDRSTNFWTAGFSYTDLFFLSNAWSTVYTFDCAQLSACSSVAGASDSFQSHSRPLQSRSSLSGTGWQQLRLIAAAMRISSAAPIALVSSTRQESDCGTLASTHQRAEE